jgi:hypothetical protein
MWIIIFESCDLNLKSHDFKFIFVHSNLKSVLGKMTTSEAIGK